MRVDFVRVDHVELISRKFMLWHKIALEFGSMVVGVGGGR